MGEKTDSERIYEKLETIDEKVSELLQWRSAVNERCMAHRKETDNLNKEVFGNPNGIKKQVMEIDKRLEIAEGKVSHSSEKETRKMDFFAYILQGLIVSGLLAFVVFMFKLYKLFS